MMNRIKSYEHKCLESELVTGTIAPFETTIQQDPEDPKMSVALLKVSPLSLRIDPSLWGEYIVTLRGNQMTVTPHVDGKNREVSGYLAAKTFTVTGVEQAQREICEFVFGEYFCPF